MNSAVRAIPASLQQYSAEIRTGLIAIERRRAELAFMANGSRLQRPQWNDQHQGLQPAADHRITIYIDGACSGNPGPGGWAALLRYPDRSVEISGPIGETTNNRAELQAGIEALRTLATSSEIDLYTDSRYVADGLAGKIHQMEKNLDLWAQLRKLAAGHEIACHWIEGHVGEQGNERVNELAQIASHQAKENQSANSWGLSKAIQIDCQKPSECHKNNLPSLPIENSCNFIAEEQKITPDRQLKFWPLVGLASIRMNEGGAWRAFTLAKNIDTDGNGLIDPVELHDLAVRLAIHPKTFHRWLQDTRKLKLIMDRADGSIVLAGNATAARVFGCEDVGMPVSIKAEALVGKGWRAFLWAAFEQTHAGKLISQTKKESLTGMPARTQRRLCNRAGVIRHPNYAISDRKADELPGVAEYESRPGAFEYWDKKRRQTTIAWRLPNSSTADHVASSLCRGRSRKINKVIRQSQQQDGSFYLERPSSLASCSQPVLRLFLATARQIRAAERLISRADLAQRDRPAELYLVKRRSPRTDLWSVVSQASPVSV